MLHISDHEETL